MLIDSEPDQVEMMLQDFQLFTTRINQALESLDQVPPL